MIKPIHPFPARMAPDLAIKALGQVPSNGIVLDPMVGSGTVVRHATDIGLTSIGVDMDPLAVLMSTVWTTPINAEVLDAEYQKLKAAIIKAPARLELPWIDDDPETSEFIEFWFGPEQREWLRRISFAIWQRSKSRLSPAQRAALNVLRLTLSRIIVTKERGASLARDTSHSRPHKVTAESDYDVLEGFTRAFHRLSSSLSSHPPRGGARIDLGDARQMKSIPNRHVDAVVTSPPYLNAIDYMRGHRLALVWLGYTLSQLRWIRSSSIGAERGPDTAESHRLFEQIASTMTQTDAMQPRHKRMIARYAEDAYRLMSEISRVLKPSGKAVLVVGNSCLQGTFINNADAMAQAGSMVGLRLMEKTERELPNTSRYLPMPKDGSAPLGKRMRSEVILTLVPV